MVESHGRLPAIFQAPGEQPICVVMNVSIAHGLNPDGTGEPAGNGAGSEQRPPSR
jgi:hypothetical protein